MTSIFEIPPEKQTIGKDGDSSSNEKTIKNDNSSRKFHLDRELLSYWHGSNPLDNSSLGKKCQVESPGSEPCHSHKSSKLETVSSNIVEKNILALNVFLKKKRESRNKRPPQSN